VTLAASDDDRLLVAGAVPDGLTVAFAREPAEGATVRFGDARVLPSDLLVAPAGEHVWRRSPWPAADDLFSLPLPAVDASTLVVEPLASRRDEAAALLRDRGVDVAVAERLSRAELERAATVVFLDDGAFPALVPAVAAAGRLTILPGVEPLFGWQDGIDCLVGSDLARLAELAVLAARRPRAFDPIRAMGRFTARPYRASDLYSRLALDVSLGVGTSDG
jgi:hypothetical protein